MSSVEDRLNAAISAAADLAAREIPAAPPLRLPPEPARRARRVHAPRRWIRWTVPLAAAAAVIALAISLALIKDIQNGSMVPPNPATTTGPGGTPRYYVALNHLAGHGANSGWNGIVVGDSLTGKAVATVAPPARTTFEIVTGAADDRTFAVYGVTSATGSFALSTKLTITGRWYKLVIAPGTDRPARLTPLPLKPFTGRYFYTSAGVQVVGAFGIVLSGSGREFAAFELAGHGLAVKVFSTATGRLLHVWTTSDKAVSAEPSLAWIDGDKKLALLSRFIQVQPNSAFSTMDVSVREWPVAGPASGDLVAVSKAVWSVQVKTPLTPLESCLELVGGSVRLSADSKTFSCSRGNAGKTGDTLRFFTYPLAASTTVTAKGGLDYQVTLPAAEGIYIPDVLWTSPSGGTLIGALFPSGLSSAAFAHGPRIGVISHGTFTPLRFPPGLNLSAGTTSIAW